MFVDDVRHALRRLRSKPATVLAAAVMLALGIGLTTAMFTLADALLLRPVPFKSPERLARVSMMGIHGGRHAVEPSVFRGWRASPAFEAVESASEGTALIETGRGPVARASATVTPGLFQMLDVRPVQGRLFLPEEGRAGADDRVLLSEDVWRAAFGADPAVVGRSIVVNGRSVLVVGVLPSDFRFPEWNTQVWSPIDFDAPPPARATERPIAYVRFAAGIPEADALRMATAAAHEADPATVELSARPQPLAGLVLDRYYQRAVPLLIGGVGLVFLVLCANVTSLLLVRLAERRREFSVCSALGASRGRLLRQSLVESAWLGVMGTMAGVALAWMLVSATRGFLPEAFLLRTLNPLNLDLRALAAASAAGLIATAIAGLVPAWIGTRLDPAEALRSGDRSGTETRTARTIARGLVVTEIALACTLLVGALLLVRSFVNLAHTDRGLDSKGVAIARIVLPGAAFKDRASRQSMTTVLEAEMRRLPGVTQVALSYGLPPDGGAVTFGDGWRSDVPGAPSLDMTVESYYVGPDFFDLYRIPLLRGRTFQSADTFNDVIVGERLAARLWPGMDPVGRSFAIDRTQLHVVGLAREINLPSIDPRIDRPEFYRPLGSRAGDYVMMSLRCDRVCPDGALIRQRLLTTSAAVQVVGVGPLDDVYFEQLAAPRAAAALGSVFAVVAVIAAAGGLFGVLSYVVGRRRREFGIRSALGASRRQIRGLVLRDGLLVGAVGLALGCVSGWSLARGLSSLQYGVTVSDPVTWSVVVGVLAVTTLAAVWRPAHTAANIDPLTLLREE